jgi:hypothetical protein
MEIRDEFEFTTDEGITYSVSVSGRIIEEDGFPTNVIDAITMSNGVEEIDEDHDDYDEIFDYAQNREYNPEIHETDFGYCEAEINNFLKER